MRASGGILVAGVEPAAGGRAAPSANLIPWRWAEPNDLPQGKALPQEPLRGRRRTGFKKRAGDIFRALARMRP